ncbi:hypothetical protein RRG08_028185 [Elysia crispata]|uniref:Uncharacterized protein n=1 Tax=Elysia crispata TaxID=231223 RepID=A0AAE1B8G5_9GAST|nr:hypothetical protein RRG08_028185 [Elysia crispata]
MADYKREVIELVGDRPLLWDPKNLECVVLWPMEGEPTAEISRLCPSGIEASIVAQMLLEPKIFTARQLHQNVSKFGE